MDDSTPMDIIESEGADVSYEMEVAQFKCPDPRNDNETRREPIMDDGAAVGIVVAVVVVGLIIALAASSGGRSSPNEGRGSATQSERASLEVSERPASESPAGPSAPKETEPKPEELTASFEETTEAAEARTATLEEVIAYLNRAAQKAEHTQERLLEAKYLQGRNAGPDASKEAKNASK